MLLSTVTKKTRFRLFYLLVLTYIHSSNCQNHFFIAKSHDENNYSCVTDSAFALSWIPEDVEETSRAVSIILPYSNNAFDNEIDFDDESRQYYEKDVWWIKESSNGIILDRRWENLPVIETNSSYGHIMPIKKKDINIAISVRATDTIYISLCENEKCYSLNFFGEKKCAITKCVESCSDEDLRKTEHKCISSDIFHNFWSHFIIRKKSNRILLIHMVQTEASHLSEEIILESKDIREQINVAQVSFHSKTRAFWKIHKLKYIYTNVESSTALGPPINPTNNLICVSMFVSMCDNCKLKLGLKAQDIEISNETYHTTNIKWNEIKFLAKNLQDTTHQLHVSTIGMPGYWAIDKVRRCQEKEFRMISSTKEGKCQLMYGENNTVSFNGLSKISTNHCPEDTLGEFCVPHEWIYKNQEQITVCSKDDTANITCSCSAGFQIDDPGHYGRYCQKCQNCHGTCHHITGKCSFCLKNYKGTKCDIPPVTCFIEPPTVTNITYIGATVHVNFEKIYLFQDDDEPSTFVVQFKKIHDKDWNSDGTHHKFNESNSIVITQMEADTTYLIRCVITTKKNMTYAGDNYIPSATFTTSCEDISEINISIKALNTSANISFPMKTRFTCRYTITISNETYYSMPTSLENNNVLFQELAPCSIYNITIQNVNRKIEKSFVTGEGVPEKVQELTATNVSPSGVKLEWQPPPPTYRCQLNRYMVEYQHISHLACNETLNESRKINLSVTGIFAEINHLIPYSEYSFAVYAVNTDLIGEPQSLKHKTLPSNKIEENEIPNILDVTPIMDSKNTVNVELSEINCAEMRGPLMMTITLICTKKWCENKTMKYKLETNLFSLRNLTAYTKYTLRLSYCRNNICSNTVKTKIFSTSPTAPHAVDDVIVYSKNESSISLRWKAPFPPTGILEHYRIRYYDGGKKYKECNVSSTSCHLWPDYNCKTLTELRSYKTYTITIHAKNKDPDEYGAPVKVTAFTKIEAPEAPYDLKVNWTTKNDLELEWKHPNRSNGDIKKFLIKIKPLNNSLTKTNEIFETENNYTLIYHHKIESEYIEPTTSFAIEIYAFNDYFGETIEMNVTSPPDLPSLSQRPNFIITNKTITIKFSLKNPQGQSDIYKIILLLGDSILFDCSYSNLSFKTNLSYTIGNNKHQENCNSSIKNVPLDPGTPYIVTVVLINSFRNMNRNNSKSYSCHTTGEKEKISKLYYLLLLASLLLLPAGTIVYLKRRQIHRFKNNLMATRSSFEEDQIPLSSIKENHTNSSNEQKKIQFVDFTDDPLYSKSIKISQFEEYVKESIQNGELERQHALFPHGQTKPRAIGSMIENKSKNRYNNLIAYDHNRVILEKVDGDPHSDYINASYIDGYQLERAYIVTQGPKASTLNDFWRMIWQENVEYIVMLANIYEGGKKKVEMYWPQLNATLQFGNIVVTHVTSKIHEYFERRIFNVTRNGKSRKVEQLHFSSWPDHGVPLYSQSLLPLLNEMLKFPLNSASPVVVHCSAGVGRTGTILLSHISLKMAEKQDSIDVLRNLQRLREQRANLVDNVEQYKLAHLVILEYLRGLNTTIPCKEIDDSVRELLENGGVPSQMQQLEDFQWLDEVMKTIGQKGKKAIVVNEKNRFQNIVPEIQGRVTLVSDSLDDEISSYINAVSVDGFRRPQRFIVTQQPMPNTLGDFWRLVEENDIKTIISLNEIESEDPTCCSFWPTSSDPQMNPVDSIKLFHVKTLSLECYDLSTIHLDATTRKDLMTVEILSMKNWPSSSNCPKSTASFLTFWEDSNAASKKSDKVIVTCYDGAKASGLYVAMSFIIEKIKLEQLCDVYQAVRTIRRNRRQFVEEEEQFTFLYQAAVDYVNRFQFYADFI